MSIGGLHTDAAIGKLRTSDKDGCVVFVPAWNNIFNMAFLEVNLKNRRILSLG